MHELLTTEEMAEADRRAVALGVPSLTLMENAGRAVADEAAKMVPPGARIAVLCGPGNNGGDGFVAARFLRERGYDVRLACLVPVAQLKGDAAEMAKRWGGEIIPPPFCERKPVTASSDTSLSAEPPEYLSKANLVIDALLGAGLDRPVQSDIKDAVFLTNAVAARRDLGIKVLAVDVPSGLNGSSGEPLGGSARENVINAHRTITFFRKKSAHVLLPGRALCGDVIVADIGIPEAVLDRREATSHPNPLPMQAQSMGRGNATFENHPSLWVPQFPFPRLDGHKYTRGHALVVSGPANQTGAARLSARGALRIGAGLVTVASPPSALAENAAHLTAIMLKPCNGARALAAILEDKRKNAVLIGPGAGVSDDTHALVEAALASGAHVVLDADALTVMANAPSPLGQRVGVRGWALSDLKESARSSPPSGDLLSKGGREERATVLTPHEGEFARLFPDIAPPGSSKLERARAAARVSGAIVVLKGPDTVIAAPDGRAAINTNAPPWLATAGSGDVLAGFICGLLAQGMPSFEAASAAVWLHGACANVFGPGLIAEDLPEVLPGALAALSRSEET